RDEQWRVAPGAGPGYVLKRLLLEEQNRGDVVPMIRALGFYCAGGFTPFVAPYLAAARLELRLAATVALGSMGHKRTTGALAPQLDDGNPETRAATAAALSNLID